MELLSDFYFRGFTHCCILSALLSVFAYRWNRNFPLVDTWKQNRMSLGIAEPFLLLFDYSLYWKSIFLREEKFYSLLFSVVFLIHISGKGRLLIDYSLGYFEIFIVYFDSFSFFNLVVETSFALVLGGLVKDLWPQLVLTIIACSPIHDFVYFVLEFDIGMIHLCHFFVNMEVSAINSVT